MLKGKRTESQEITSKRFDLKKRELKENKSRMSKIYGGISW